MLHNRLQNPENNLSLYYDDNNNLQGTKNKQQACKAPPGLGTDENQYSTMKKLKSGGLQNKPSFNDNAVPIKPAMKTVDK